MKTCTGISRSKVKCGHSEYNGPAISDGTIRAANIWPAPGTGIDCGTSGPSLDLATGGRFTDPGHDVSDAQFSTGDAEFSHTPAFDAGELASVVD